MLLKGIPMDINKLCLSCMKAREIGEFCPHCGYKEGTAPTSQQFLSPGEILSDKYLVGKTLKEESYGILYIGYHIDLGRKVKIYEYLPSAYAFREDNKRSVQTFDDHQSKQFNDGKASYLAASKKLSDNPNLKSNVLDLVKENNTLYIVTDYVENDDLSSHLRQTALLPNTSKISKPIIKEDNISGSDSKNYFDTEPNTTKNKHVDNSFSSDSDVDSLNDLWSGKSRSGKVSSAPESQALPKDETTKVDSSKTKSAVLKSAKKKFYQKWWFWVIIGVVLLFIFIGSCGWDSEEDNSPIAPLGSTINTEHTETPKEDNEPESNETPKEDNENEQTWDNDGSLSDEDLEKALENSVWQFKRKKFTPPDPSLDFYINSIQNYEKFDTYCTFNKSNYSIELFYYGKYKARYPSTFKIIENKAVCIGNNFMQDTDGTYQSVYETFSIDKDGNLLLYVTKKENGSYLNTSISLVFERIKKLPDKDEKTQEDPDPEEQEDLGIPAMGNIGAKIHYISSHDSIYYGKPIGFMIDTLSSNSPAKKAGLESGDIIVEIDGYSVPRWTESRYDVLRSLKDGDTVKIGYWPKLSDFEKIKTVTLTADDIDGYYLKSDMDLIDFSTFTYNQGANQSLTALGDIIYSGTWILVGGSYNYDSINPSDDVLPMDGTAESMNFSSTLRMAGTTYYRNNQQISSGSYDIAYIGNMIRLSQPMSGESVCNIYMGNDMRLYVAGTINTNANILVENAHYQVYENDMMDY
jgi:hypothetical protein